MTKNVILTGLAGLTMLATLNSCSVIIQFRPSFL